MRSPATGVGTALVYGILGSDQMTTTFYLQALTPSGAAVGQALQLGSQAGEATTTLSMVATDTQFLVCWATADVGLSCLATDLAGNLTPGFASPGSQAALAVGPSGNWVFFYGDAGVVGQPLTSTAQAAAGPAQLGGPNGSSVFEGSLAAVGVASGYALVWDDETAGGMITWVNAQGAAPAQTALNFQGLDSPLALASTGDSVLLAYLDLADDVQGLFQAGATGTPQGPFPLPGMGAVVGTGVAVCGAPPGFASAWTSPQLSFRAVSSAGTPLAQAVTPANQPGSSAAPLALTAVDGGFLVAASGITGPGGDPLVFLTSFACP